MDGEQLFPTEEGVMQGSPLSPLLANIALHGLETAIVESFPRRRWFHLPSVVRYADDFVILHAERQVKLLKGVAICPECDHHRQTEELQSGKKPRSCRVSNTASRSIRTTARRIHINQPSCASGC